MRNLNFRYVAFALVCGLALACSAGIIDAQATEALQLAGFAGMFHYERELPAFNTPSANNTHSTLAPRGPSYRGLVFNPTISGVNATTAEMASQIAMARVRINATARYELSADTIQDLNAYYGYSAVNGYLPVFFTYEWFRTVPALEGLVWGTRNVDSMSIEMQLGAGATIDGNKCYGIITPEERDLGLIMEAHTFTYAPSASGTFEISDLPKAMGSLFALHLDGSICTRADLKINGVEIRQVPNDISKNWQTWQGKRTPQTNYVHIDPTTYARLADDRIPLYVPDPRDNNRMKPVSDFRVIATVSGAGTLKAHMLTINQPFAPLI